MCLEPVHLLLRQNCRAKSRGEEQWRLICRAQRQQQAARQHAAAEGLGAPRRRPHRPDRAAARRPAPAPRCRAVRTRPAPPPFFAPPFFAPPAATHRMLLQARPDQREGELPRGAHLLENADDRGQPVGALRVAHEHCGLDRSGQRRRLQLRLRRVEGDAAAGSLRRRPDDARSRRPLAGRAIAGCRHGDRLG